jgi:uracil-DNA glycosylase family 4
MMNQQAKNLLKKARDLLAFHRKMGLSEVELSPEISKFLGEEVVAPTAEQTPTKTGSKPTTSSSFFKPAPDSAIGLPLEEIYQDINDCTKCSLHNKRRNIVPGCGPAGASLFIIEDQPTAAEDEKGHPLAGDAGELFDKMMKAIGLDRSQIYLASIVKCRPEEDRDPDPQETRTCLSYLARQIAAVNPTVICTMGPLAARVLTGNHQSLFRFRGRFHDFHGTPLMPTFHPRFLLKNPEMKKASWVDLQTIQKKLPESKDVNK